MALNATYVAHLDTKGLISNFAVALTVTFSRRVILALPLELILRLVIFFLAFFLRSGWWLVHKIYAQLILAFLAQ